MTKEKKNTLVKSNLSDDQLKKFKKEISESLARDRHRILTRYPFIGSLAMRFDLVPVRDKRCRTACTDGENIYFDISFYSELQPEERIFVLAHEVGHCMMLHLSRKQTRDAQLFNIATDMEVNYMLADPNAGIQVKAPDGLCWPMEGFEGKSAEVMYEALLKLRQKNMLRQALRQMGNGGSSSGQSDDSNSQNQKNKSSNGKDGDKKLKGQFDRHEYANEPNGQDGNKEGQDEQGCGRGRVTDQWGDVGYDDDFHPGVADDVSEKMREAVVAAAQEYERSRGALPAGLTGMISKIMKPEINWKEHLAQFVTKAYHGAKLVWNPPSRRRLYHGIYFQSKRNEKITGIAAIDTSGSTAGDMPKFFGELKALLDSFGSYELTRIDCDAKVNHVEKYDDQENPINLEELDKIEYYGGGGTELHPVFEYIQNEQIQADFVIVFTDGFCEQIGDEFRPSIPVLWLIAKGGDKDFCNWGEKIEFKESSFE